MPFGLAFVGLLMNRGQLGSRLAPAESSAFAVEFVQPFGYQVAPIVQSLRIEGLVGHSLAASVVQHESFVDE